MKMKKNEKMKFSLSSIGDNPRKPRSKEVTPEKGKERSVMTKTRYKETREKEERRPPC